MSSEFLDRQPQVLSFLESALESGRLPHALLFAGPAGVGQREAVTMLAKSLFCDRGRPAVPCEVCVQCRQVSGGTHPDLTVLEIQKDAKFIKIEAVRELVARANLKPFQAAAKLFVVDGAERMNEDAQNALLKTLEEPEGNTFFVLIASSPERLLATIRSRVQTLRFLSAEGEETPGRELELLGRQFSEAVLGRKRSDETDWSRLDREVLGKVFDGGIRYLRDLLMIRVGAPDLVPAGHEKLEKEKTALEFQPEELRDKIDCLAEFKERLLENANIRLLVAVLFEKLR
jgi:DNA polymerase III delta' subunit